MINHFKYIDIMNIEVILAWCALDSRKYHHESKGILMMKMIAIQS